MGRREEGGGGRRGGEEEGEGEGGGGEEGEREKGEGGGGGEGEGRETSRVFFVAVTGSWFSCYSRDLLTREYSRPRVHPRDYPSSSPHPGV